MTLAIVIAKTRTVLNDGTGSSKYLDADITEAIADAIRHLWSVNPVTRYDDNGKLVEKTLPSASTDVIPVPDRYLLGLAYYAAARCYEGNITDTVNVTLSNALFQKAAVEFV